MPNNIVKLSALLFLVLQLTGLHAQEAIITSGGDASGSTGSVSYSIGQVVYTTNNGTNGSAAQGVQQPYEISVVTGLEEAKGINLDFSVYPNPAINYVTLKIENYKTENLMYQLYDNNGKLFENKKVTGSETQIDMSSLVISTYFLKVSNANKVLKIFKIIKN